MWWSLAMNLLSAFAIFLLGASAGSILRYFQDRRLLHRYQEEAKKSFQALLEVMNACEGNSLRKIASTGKSTARIRSESIRSA
jgi:hypothetical protein